MSDSSKYDYLGIEPKHIVYLKAQDGSRHDALVVKEVGHLKNKETGELEHKVRLKVLEDYKRPFWVTDKGKQVHKDKRPYEYLENLQKYVTTQIEMPGLAAKILGDYTSGFNPPLRKLARSPYLYGADITTPVLLKNEYRSKWPNLFSRNKVAGGDIETNVHSDEQEIIMMSVTHRENVALFYLKSWLGDEPDPINRTHQLADELIGEYMKKRNIQLEVVICDTPGQIVVEAVNRLHTWRPDFFTFWNMGFDISRMEEALKNENIDPKDVFSDPSIPEQYRYFQYKEGPTQKVTASGKVLPIAVEDRWNWTTHPAMFQTIDSMPVYRVLRVAAGKDSSYAFDDILYKELGITKFRYKPTEHLKKLRFHEVMQTEHKIPYGIYNIFDSMALELLDEHTGDLASNISLHSKNSDYRNFNSNPKRLIDDMHFFHLDQERPAAIGTSSDDPTHELDRLVVDHAGWIVTLPSFMASPTGMKCIEEYPDYSTMIFTHVAD